MSSPAETTVPQPGRRSVASRRLSALIVAAAFVAAVLAVHPGASIDDSFILYRYAVNLAAGLGPCFTPGEPVEGFTCFSWTYLLAGMAWLGLDLVRWAPVVGVVFGLGGVAATFALARGVGLSERFALLATVLTALACPVTYWASQGLETPLYSLLLLLGVVLDVQALERPGRRRLLASSLALGAAAITRPEGAFAFGLASALLGADVLRGRRPLRDWLAHAVPFAATLGPVLGWRLLTFGVLVPNTYWTKVHSNPLLNVQRGFPYLRDSLDLLGGQVWLNDTTSGVIGALVFGGAVLCGLRVGGARRRTALYVGLYVSAILFEGGDWMPYARFFVPIVPLMLVLLVACCADVEPAGPRHVATAALVLWLATGWTLDAFKRLAGPRGLRRDAQGLHHAHEAIARWLARERRPGDSVAAGDIGYIGYYADMPLIDLLGLVDPRLSRMPGAFPHKRIDIDAVLDRRPTFAVIVGGFPEQGRLAASARFQAEYRLVFARNLGAFMEPPKPHWLIVYVRHDRVPQPTPLPSSPGQPAVLQGDDP